MRYVPSMPRCASPASSHGGSISPVYPHSLMPRPIAFTAPVTRADAARVPLSPNEGKSPRLSNEVVSGGAVPSGAIDASIVTLIHVIEHDVELKVASQVHE